MTRRKINVEQADGRSVPNVPAEICPDCGETYFDLRAMEMLEDRDHRPVGRRRAISKSAR